MASASGAFSAKAGFNQSGGKYLMVLETNVALVPKMSYYTGGSGSGGATTVGSLSTVVGATSYLPNGTSSLFANGRLVRDMGKTLISAGRSFRKIQAVQENGVGASYGVTGAAAGTASTADAGYLSFYVETGAEGTASAANIPLLVRFM